MQATVIRQHGGPQRLLVEEIAQPTPGPNEVLVRVAACGINHLDIFVRRGMPKLPVSLPHTTGGDIAGWVSQLGPAVSGVDIGRPALVDPAVDGGALGETKAGGLAEYVVVPAGNLIPLSNVSGEHGDGFGPSHLGTEVSQLIAMAALPIAYGTAHHMLFDRAELRHGETVVIVGASGGVGVACLQLAKRVGATVVACTSTEEKARRLRLLGADQVVIGVDGEFGSDVWAQTGRKGADVVVDYSGQATWPQSLRCVRRGGRLVTCGATSGYEAVTDLRYVWVREINIVGSDGWTRTGLDELVRLVDKGELQPVIHRLFPLSRSREAIAELEERRAFGKVIVLPDEIYNASEIEAAG